MELVLLSLLSATVIFNLLPGNVTEEDDDDTVSQPEALPPEPVVVPPEPELPPVIETPAPLSETIYINGDDTADNITGSEQHYGILTLGGNDTVTTFGGDDSVFGGDGDDVLSAGNGNNILGGGPGDDLMQSGDGNDLANGDDGQDTIYAGAGDDRLTGGEGADNLWAEDGDDSLFGDAANDHLYGGAGDDLLNGADGDDRLFGQGGVDTLRGGAGDDFLVSYNDGNIFERTSDGDILEGGDGNDYLLFADGASATGGDGQDVFAVYESLSNQVVSKIEDFEPGIDKINVSVIAGDGDGGGFRLEDRADGLGKDLYLGDDLVVEIFSRQNFSLDALDFDTVYLDNTDAAGKTFTLTADDADLDYFLSLSPGDDTIIGSDADEQISTLISGGQSSNYIDGADGNDTLVGHGGHVTPFEPPFDVIESNPDTLLGGDGDDDLYSWESAIMTGGAGSDAFVVTVREETLGLLPPAMITDFNAADGDVLAVGNFYNSGDFDLQRYSFAPLDDSSGSLLMLDDIVVVQITGGHSLTTSDLMVATNLRYELADLRSLQT
jgi:Ca2+-binding RTX toxin-like protein